MTKAHPYDRRRDKRRHVDLGPPPLTSERQDIVVASRVEACPDFHVPHAMERRKQDRRVAERRQVNLGPPPGIEERRFRPDPRGVVFIYVDDA